MAILLTLEPSSSITTPAPGKLVMHADSGSNSIRVVKDTGAVSYLLTDVSGTNVGSGIPIFSGSIVSNSIKNLIFYSVTGSGQTSVVLSGSTIVVSAAAAQGSVFPSDLQSQRYTYFVTSGTSPNFLLTPSPAITSYLTGSRFSVLFHSASFVSGTINVNGLGAKNLRSRHNIGGAKRAVEIRLSQSADIIYDGTDFLLL